MLKRRTIAMLVAGTLIGAQAGIAANDQESTATDTYYLVPVEQTIILEPVVLSEVDISGPTSDLVVIEEVAPATIYVASAEPFVVADADRHMKRDVPRDTRSYSGHDRVLTPTNTAYTSTELPFKGHPFNASETAGWTPEQVAGSQPTMHRRDHRAAGFPMSYAETAGASTQTLEQERLAASSRSDFQVASATPSTRSPMTE